MPDKPIDQILQIMDEQVRVGNTVYFKYTCEGCGERVVSDQPNSYHLEGYTCSCGHLTKPTVGGILWVSGSAHSFGWEKELGD